MKTYQIKITIRNSKPPIWRRIIIPGGITFSEFSVILNEAMGWSGSHAFSFDFKDGVNIYEECDEFSEEPPFDNDLEASETYINDFLDQNGSFTYIYDLGDYWDHKVVVEKIFEDQRRDYAAVIKFRGNCPVEDCGGIDGYYEYVNILSDGKDQRHREISEWMKSQGYPQEYDVKKVNLFLKDNCFYKWGRRDPRTSFQIIMDIYTGKTGLKAVKNPRVKRPPERDS